MNSETTDGWRTADDEADLTVWLNRTTPLFFRLIPAGTFRMGERGGQAEAEPPHDVEISRPFFLGTFRVTQAQWRAVVEQFPDANLDADPSHFKGATGLVEQVSWEDVAAWCQSVVNSNLLSGLVAADGAEVAVQEFGLPTEVQWEYACRAGTDMDYYTGDGAAALAEAGWFDQNSEIATHPVGGLVPNAFGLYDMHGNVDEWCRDAWDADAYKKRVDGMADPKVRAANVGSDDLFRVVRGGSWVDSAWNCREAIRIGWLPGSRNRYPGFRVCMVPGPVAESEQSVERDGVQPAES